MTEQVREAWKRYSNVPRQSTVEGSADFATIDRFITAALTPPTAEWDEAMRRALHDAQDAVADASMADAEAAVRILDTAHRAEVARLTAEVDRLRELRTVALATCAECPVREPLSLCMGATCSFQPIRRAALSAEEER